MTTRTGLDDDYSLAIYEANHGISPPMAGVDSHGMRGTTVSQLAREFGCEPRVVLCAILELYPDMQIRVDTSGGQRARMREWIEDTRS